MRLFIVLFFIVPILGFTQSSASETVVLTEKLAFPGAFGYGRYTSGGRGGRIIEVTNTNYNGPGSLKAALEATGPRIILIRTSGVITLRGYIYITDANSDFSIIGQTAPNQGITIKGYPILSALKHDQAVPTDEGAHNLIMRHITHRKGNRPKNDGSGENYEEDNITFRNSTGNIYLDHISTSYGADEAISLQSNVKPFLTGSTVANCFMAECDPAHNTGGIMGSKSDRGNLEDSGNITYAYNGFYNISHRFPNPSGGGNMGIIEMYNNFASNWYSKLSRINGSGNFDYLNNYFKNGNIVKSSNQFLFMTWSFYNGFEVSIHSENTFIEGYKNDIKESDNTWWRYFRDSDGVTQGDLLPEKYFSNTRHSHNEFGPAGLLATVEVPEYILNNVGHNRGSDLNGYPVDARDAQDTRYINAIRSDLEPTSYPTITEWSITEPLGGKLYIDANSNGIADTFEDLHSLSGDGLATTINWDFGTYTVINNAGYYDREIYWAWLAGDFDRMIMNADVSEIFDKDDIYLESECATVGSNWSIINNTSTSNGSYLAPPSNNQISSAPTDSTSLVTFNFNAAAGTYKIYGRVLAPNGNSDSFWVRVNGSSWVKWNLIEHSNSFIWDEVHNQPGSDVPVPVTFNLIDGSNIIDIANREEGTLLDKLYLTKTDILPLGVGQLATNCQQNIPVTSVLVSESSIDLSIGDTSILTAIVDPMDATDQGVSWSSNDTNVATVDQNGTVTATGSGSTTITVTTDDGGMTDISTVTVVSSSSTITLEPIHDAYLQGSSRVNNELLKVDDGNRVSYLKYDLSSVPGTITDAELLFRITDDTGNGSAEIYKGSDTNWTETNLSSSNRPTESSLWGSTTDLSDTTDDVIVPLSASGTLGGGTLSLIVKHNGSNDFAYASKEHGTRPAPRLVLSYRQVSSLSARIFNNNVASEKDVLRLYPNPTTNSVYIMGLEGPKEISIVDFTGKVICRTTSVSREPYLDLSGYSPGSYFIEVTAQNEQKIFKVIKK
ncbi:Ig-like domain-containing protein [Zobellia laminariae]|uniref:Ig-like domain-containing protein n=1 Tax=Zobellia laminariae TaxID=248906 RepID=UPI00405701EF